MCTDDLVVPFEKFGFRVFWTLGLAYQLFYERKTLIELNSDEFSKRLNIYREKIREFAPRYFIGDSGFFASILGRLRYITQDKMVGLWVDFVKDLNDRGIITIISCVDDPWQFAFGKRNLLAIRNAFRIVKTHSMQLEEYFLKQGQNVIYFPNYVSTNFTAHTIDTGDSLVKENIDESVFSFDLFFVGRMSAARKIFFWRLSRQLKDLDYFFGNRQFFYTSRKEITFDPSNQNHISQIYKKSSINIIYGSANDSFFTRTWGVTDRLFNIAYVGGFFLNDYRRHLLDLFDIDPKLYTFKSLRECCDKIETYLQNNKLRKELAQRFQAQVTQQHTVEERVKRFIQELEKIDKL